MNLLPIRHLPRVHALAGTLAGLALLGGLGCTPPVQEEPTPRPRSAESDAAAMEKQAPTVAVNESPVLAARHSWWLMAVTSWV